MNNEKVALNSLAESQEKISGFICILEGRRERLESEKSTKKLVGTFKCEVGGSAPKRRKGKFGGFFE